MNVLSSPANFFILIMPISSSIIIMQYSVFIITQSQIITYNVYDWSCVDDLWEKVWTAVKINPGIKHLIMHLIMHALFVRGNDNYSIQLLIIFLLYGSSISYW